MQLLWNIHMLKPFWRCKMNDIHSFLRYSLIPSTADMSRQLIMSRQWPVISEILIGFHAFFLVQVQDELEPIKAMLTSLNWSNLGIGWMEYWTKKVLKSKRSNLETMRRMWRFWVNFLQLNRSQFSLIESSECFRKLNRLLISNYIMAQIDIYHFSFNSYWKGRVALLLDKVTTPLLS